MGSWRWFHGFLSSFGAPLALVHNASFPMLCTIWVQMLWALQWLFPIIVLLYIHSLTFQKKKGKKTKDYLNSQLIKDL